MNILDDHDATSDELTQLGARLRSGAEARPGDLPGLDRRIHASRQRARLALVAGCAAVVLVLAAGIGLREGGESSLQVGDEGTGGVSLATEAAAPGWTVNPSIPFDPAHGEVWAIDVVFDPAVWDFELFTVDPALRPMLGLPPGALVSSGMAGYKDEPRFQAYWQGADARTVAEAARDALAGRPGVVSVEVGRAEPTSRPPGTGQVGSVPPGSVSSASVAPERTPTPGG